MWVECESVWHQTMKGIMKFGRIVSIYELPFVLDTSNQGNSLGAKEGQKSFKFQLLHFLLLCNESQRVCHENTKEIIQF